MHLKYPDKKEKMYQWTFPLLPTSIHTMKEGMS